MQDSTHSSKKSTCQSPTPKGLEASQNIAFARYHLAVRGFLQGLRKPASPPYLLSEAAQTPKLQSITSTGHDDLLSTNSVAALSGPGLLDPPESIPSETDNDQVFSLALEARRLEYPFPESTDESDVLMKTPKVIGRRRAAFRPYPNKIRHL